MRQVYRLTAPQPAPVHWASTEDAFQERLDWYRRQPAPRQWPSGLVRMFVSIQVETGRELLAFNARIEQVRQQVRQFTAREARHDPG